ncbi:TorF family putative porin [Pacificimonas sp. ICDLI1SI03]
MKIFGHPTGILALALVAGAAGIGTAASAQDTGLEAATDTSIPSDWSLSGNVGFVTDYRFRGISFSDENLAVQGGLDVAHSSGFYVGTWASSLGGYGTYGGPNLEVDLYGGYGGSLGGVGTYDVGVIYYLYPGGAGNNDYIEFYGSLGAEVGPLAATVGTAWNPDQDSLGGDNIYVYGDLGADIPGTPFSLAGHLGYSNGSMGFGGSGIAPDGTFASYDDDYLDWSVGVSTELFGLSLGLTYLDTNISKTRENVVGTRVTGSGSPYVADDQFVASLGYSF